MVSLSFGISMYEGMTGRMRDEGGIMKEELGGIS
jgi:hypothetical protein